MNCPKIKNKTLNFFTSDSYQLFSSHLMDQWLSKLLAGISKEICNFFLFNCKNNKEMNDTLYDHLICVSKSKKIILRWGIWSQNIFFSVNILTKVYRRGGWIWFVFVFWLEMPQASSSLANSNSIQVRNVNFENILLLIFSIMFYVSISREKNQSWTYRIKFYCLQIPYHHLGKKCLGNLQLFQNNFFAK